MFPYIRRPGAVAWDDRGFAGLRDPLGVHMKQKLVWFIWGLLLAVQAAAVNAQDVCPPALKPAVQ
ncbi:MAG: hypothetical protein KDH48_24125, partial [Rhodoferax sp.]|nr:hypothetical protein [Rhodoferax sp.]